MLQAGDLKGLGKGKGRGTVWKLPWFVLQDLVATRQWPRPHVLLGNSMWLIYKEVHLTCHKKSRVAWNLKTFEQNICFFKKPCPSKLLQLVFLLKTWAFKNFSGPFELLDVAFPMDTGCLCLSKVPPLRTILNLESKENSSTKMLKKPKAKTKGLPRWSAQQDCWDIRMVEECWTWVLFGAQALELDMRSVDLRARTSRR